MDIVISRSPPNIFLPILSTYPTSQHTLKQPLIILFYFRYKTSSWLTNLCLFQMLYPPICRVDPASATTLNKEPEKCNPFYLQTGTAKWLSIYNLGSCGPLWTVSHIHDKVGKRRVTRYLLKLSLAGHGKTPPSLASPSLATKMSLKNTIWKIGQNCISEISFLGPLFLLSFSQAQCTGLVHYN